MRRAIAALIIGAMALSAAVAAAPQPKTKKIKTLIITGRDVPVHEWRKTTPALRKLLEATGKFEVYVSEDPAILESENALKKYDLIVLNYYNWKAPTISDAAKKNFAAFVRGGKGLVAFHLSSASFKEWDEFHKMVGRYWVMGKSGHGPRGKFKARVVKPDHPITKGVPKEFETDDELYSKLLGDTPINVLVEAYSDWSKRVEPLAFTVTYGKGRVYHHCFGHDVRAITNPPVARLFVQGAEWAATGKVE